MALTHSPTKVRYRAARAAKNLLCLINFTDEIFHQIISNVSAFPSYLSLTDSIRKNAISAKKAEPRKSISVGTTFDIDRYDIVKHQNIKVLHHDASSDEEQMICVLEVRNCGTLNLGATLD